MTEYGPILCHFQSLVENILYYRPTLCRLQPLVRNILYYRSTLCYPQCLVENILHYVSVLDTERGQKRQPLVLFKGSASFQCSFSSFFWTLLLFSAAFPPFSGLRFFSVQLFLRLVLVTATPVHIFLPFL